MIAPAKILVILCVLFQGQGLANAFYHQSLKKNWIDTIQNISAFSRGELLSSTGKGAENTLIVTALARIDEASTIDDINESEKLRDGSNKANCSIGDIPVERMPLRRNDPTSPWCYVVSHEVDTDASVATYDNFLATQVWPSARACAMALNKYVLNRNEVTVGNQYQKDILSICEFGCGPGLPSVSVASRPNTHIQQIIATDIDPFALKLVQQAVREQQYTSEEQKNNNKQFPSLKTRLFDLTDLHDDNLPPKADLYLLCDVFENSSVAKGSAYHVSRLLLHSFSEDVDSSRQKKPLVWVFAQWDRAQRDVFVKELEQQIVESLVNREHPENVKDLEQHDWKHMIREHLSWRLLEHGPLRPSSDNDIAMIPSAGDASFSYINSILRRLWLCDVDELKVHY